MSRLALGLVLGMVCFSLNQVARALDGIYTSLGVGVVVPASLDAPAGGVGGGPLEENFEASFFGSAALGRRFESSEQRFRVEGEVVHSRYDFDNLNSVPAEGEFKYTAFMANVQTDLDQKIWGMQPYLGAGIGIAGVDANNARTATTTFISDDDSEMAFQFMLGVSRPIGDSTKLDIGYRFFGTRVLNFQGSAGQFENDGVQNHKLEARIRFLY